LALSSRPTINGLKAMANSQINRFLACVTLVATLTIAGIVLGCARDASTSPPSLAAPASAVHVARNRARPRRIAAIASQAADVKRRGLREDERARVSALSARFRWIGDVHHAAMQAGIRDESLRPARDGRATMLRCDAQVRYLTRFFPRIEAQTGSRFPNDVERREAMRAFASQVGDCAPAMNAVGTHPFFPPRRSSPGDATRAIRADTMSDRWADYATSITAGLRSAKSLEDARAMIDAHVAVAAGDDSLSSVGLDIVAGIAELTTSSAIEWDTYFKPPEASLFLWGWLSSLGEFLVNVVVGDVEGCIAGVGATLGMDDGFWVGTAVDFINTMSAACTAGGIVGSLLAAF